MPLQATSLSPQEPLKPLAARSVVLSLLLWSHPQPHSAGHVIRAGEYFDVADSTLRAGAPKATAPRCKVTTTDSARYADAGPSTNKG